MRGITDREESLGVGMGECALRLPIYTVSTAVMTRPCTSLIGAAAVGEVRGRVCMRFSLGGREVVVGIDSNTTAELEEAWKSEAGDIIPCPS